MCKKISPALSLLLALLLLLTACGQSSSVQQQPQQPETPPEPYTLTIASSGDDSKTISFHLFENLLRWVDDSTGYAVLAPGQAESYSYTCDYAGFATYTFLLRQDICWSDGTPVTAQHFVDAWQHIADPAVQHPHSELLSIVSGYDHVQETGDPDFLGVSAPTEHMFVVTLSGSCAHFLEELCAGTETMPIRTDLLQDGSMTGTVTNGAYVRSEEDPSLLLRSESYYDAAAVLPDRLHFVPSVSVEADYASLLAGELDLVQTLPASALEECAEDPLWTPEAVTTSYAVMFNMNIPPFDQPEIRRAFALAIDEEAVAAALHDPTARPASGFVPYGVSDYSSQRPAIEAPREAPILPNPTASPDVEETPVVYWDFRVHSQDLLTQTNSSDYAADCLEARALLAQMGYANGGGFPMVEYLYVASNANRAVAQALQAMWSEQLGVTVTLRGVTQEEYEAAIAPSAADIPTVENTEIPAEAPVPSFNMAAQSFTSHIDDAICFLQRWHSDSSENVCGYTSAAFDILIDSALAAVSPEFTDARDAYLHDAEAILLSDSALIPLYFEGSSFAQHESINGLYRRPNGTFFLFSVEKAKTVPAA